MILEYCKYMNGGHQLPDIMKMRMKDFMFWYEIHERQIIEDGILSDLSKRDKPFPSSKRLETLIDKKIEKLRSSIA